MDIIDEEDFEKIEVSETPKSKVQPLTKEKFKQLLKDLKDPVKIQQGLAAKVKHYLDVIVDKELAEEGKLSTSTLAWVRQLNAMCESIHKEIHGDKSVNLHLHKVSHQDIAAKVRAANKEILVVDNENRRSKSGTDSKDGR